MLNQDYRDMLSCLRDESVTSKYERPITLCGWLVMCVALATGCHTSSLQSASAAQLQGAGAAQQVFDQYVERVRSTRYWQRVQPDDEVYAEGKQIGALVFWTRTTQRPKYGFCAPALKRCVSNSSVPQYRGVVEVVIDLGFEPRQAFEAFAASNYGDGGASFPSLKKSEFEFEQRTLTLPTLGLPAAILHKLGSEEAVQEVEKWRKGSACWGEGTRRPAKCTGTLVFPYYNVADQDWHVLRTCTSACPPDFQGEAILSLSRRGSGWVETIGGFSNNKEDVAWYKPRIEKAVMDRIEIPPTPEKAASRPVVPVSGGGLPNLHKPKRIGVKR